MLIAVKIAVSLAAYPIKSSQTEITADGPWVRARQVEIAITVIVMCLR